MATESAQGEQQDANRRVKVYVLGGDGQWDDRGTGYVNCELIQEYDAPGFRVSAENTTDKDLLVTKIFEEEVFQRQGDTIVTWTNPETREDVALSFQEAKGAQQVWEIICQVQGRSPSDHLDEDPDAGGADGVRVNGNDDLRDIKVPPAELQNLEQLHELVQNATNMTRDRIVEGVMAEGYLAKLFQIFRDCEDLEMTNSLHTLFLIFRGLIMLNEPSLIEQCLSDTHVLDTMGILEHDPDYQNHEIRHRGYVGNPSHFKQAVPIKDPETLAKIHLNFRLHYLKDVVMARYIDDMSFSTIRELIALNNVDIIREVQRDEQLLGELFDLCRSGAQKTFSGSKPENGRQNGFLFLRELFEIAKQLTMPNQLEFFRAVATNGLFTILEDAVQADDATIVTAATDILLIVLNHDPGAVRSFMLKDQDPVLLKNLIFALLHNEDAGLKGQVTEILRLILEPSQMTTVPDRDKFLNLFYERHMDDLMSPFLQAERWSVDGRYYKDGHPEGAPGGGAVSRHCTAEEQGRREAWDAARKHVVELLSFAVEDTGSGHGSRHGFRIKYYMLRHDVLQKVLVLLEQPDKHLILAALRFLRQCIGVNEVFYNRMIVKKDLFSGVINLLKQHLHRNNLINSTIIELFDHLRTKNIKLLIKNLVEKYRAVYEHLTYVETFQQLITKYDQNEEYAKDEAAGNIGGGNSAHGYARGPRGAPSNLAGRRSGGMGSFRSRSDDDNDDDYFEGGSDDEEAAGPPAPSLLAPGGGGARRKPEEPTGLAALGEYGDEDEAEEEAGGGGDEARQGGGGHRAGGKGREEGEEEGREVKRAKRASTD